MYKYLYSKNIIHYTFWCFDECYWEELCRCPSCRISAVVAARGCQTPYLSLFHTCAIALDL